jgi:methyl coenzyme M reductase subunit C-like uncharacterized protein (methanogenesis marker protein 7)
MNRDNKIGLLCILNAIFWIGALINSFQEYETKFQKILHEHNEMLLKIKKMEDCIELLELKLENSIKQAKEDTTNINNISSNDITSNDITSNDITSNDITGNNKNVDIDIVDKSVEELIQMLKEDKPDKEDKENKQEDELVDLSEETYPVKNPNKKSWIKTLFFM